MIINGYDYHFAYTVGAFVEIGNLHLSPGKTCFEITQNTIRTAVIMSKQWEDRERINDTSYKPRYLTLNEVYALDIERMGELTKAVGDAIAVGTHREVVAESLPNAVGEAQEKE